MPYIIQTRKRREKTVQTFLERNGIPSRISPAKEYVICLADLSLPPHLKGHPQIVKVIAATAEDAKKMLVIKINGPPALKAGDTVTVKGGDYDGLTGMLANIEGEKATVHLTVFGKILPAVINTDELVASAVPDIWR